VLCHYRLSSSPWNIEKFKVNKQKAPYYGVIVVKSDLLLIIFMICIFSLPVPNLKGIALVPSCS